MALTKSRGLGCPAHARGRAYGRGWACGRGWAVDGAVAVDGFARYKVDGLVAFVRLSQNDFGYPVSC